MPVFEAIFREKNICTFDIGSNGECTVKVKLSNPWSDLETPIEVLTQERSLYVRVQLGRPIEKIKVSEEFVTFAIEAIEKFCETEEI